MSRLSIIQVYRTMVKAPLPFLTCLNDDEWVPLEGSLRFWSSVRSSSGNSSNFITAFFRYQSRVRVFLKTGPTRIVKVSLKKLSWKAFFLWWASRKTTATKIHDASGYNAISSFACFSQLSHQLADTARESNHYGKWWYEVTPLCKKITKKVSRGGKSA